MYSDKHIKKIISHCLSKEPFFGTVGMSLGIEVTDKHKGRAVKTAAVDGRNLYINDEYFKSLGTGKQVTLVLHEWMHHALGHSFRRGDRDFWIWNQATDHVINNILKEKGYEPIDGWLCDPIYAGMSEEKVYSRLALLEEQQRQQQRQHQQEQQDREESNQEEEQGDGSSDPSGPPDDTEEGGKSGDNNDQPNTSESGSGDGEGEKDKTEEKIEDPNVDSSSGSSQENESEGDSKDKSGAPGSGGEASPTGEVWDYTGEDGNRASQEEMKEAAREVMEKLANSREIMNKTMGNSSSVNESRAVSRVLSRKKDWSQQLKNFVKSAGRPSGYTWSRLDRRGMARGQYQPGVVEEGIGTMVVGFDVSGSIALRECQAFISEIEKIRKTIPVEKIYIVPFNSIVLQDQIKILKKGDMIPTHFDVGGGTRFSPVMNWIAHEKIKPDCLMMFTDLGSNDYGDKPKYPVLWASSEEVYSIKDSDITFTNAPPFGKVISVDIG